MLWCHLFKRFDAHQSNTFSCIVSLSEGRWFMPLQTAWGELSHRFPEPRAVFLHHQLTSTSLESWIILWMLLLWCSGIYAVLDKQHFTDWLSTAEHEDFLKGYQMCCTLKTTWNSLYLLDHTIPKTKIVCLCNLSTKHNNLLCL